MIQSRLTTPTTSGLTRRQVLRGGAEVAGCSVLGGELRLKSDGTYVLEGVAVGDAAMRAVAVSDGKTIGRWQ